MNKTLQIRINALKVNCILGIHKKERQKKQPILVNIEITLKQTNRLSNSTDCRKTIDWEVLSAKVKSLLIKSKFYLAEEAAQEIAMLIIELPKTKDVKVEVLKKEAIKNVTSVSAIAIVSR